MKWEFDSGAFSDDDVRTAFRVWGFVVIRGVLDRPEVQSLRSKLDEVFTSDHLKDQRFICTSEFLKHEAVWRTLFTGSIVRSLKATLGANLCYQNDMDVPRSSYGMKRWQSHTGWHMDAGSESGSKYLTAPDYRFAKCAIFLQDYDNGWGGGIRVKWKSHRALSEPNRFKRWFFFLKRSAIYRLDLRLHLDVDTFELPTKAGDFCFFDSRLWHASAAPSRKNIQTIGYDRMNEAVIFWPEIPKEHTKYIIYWDACNAAMAEDFLRNSMKRSEIEKPGMIEQSWLTAVYTRILSLTYPDDFPDAFIDAAKHHGITVASLAREQALFYKQKLKTMRLVHP